MASGVNRRMIRWLQVSPIQLSVLIRKQTEIVFIIEYYKQGVNTGLTRQLLLTMLVRRTILFEQKENTWLKLENIDVTFMSKKVVKPFEMFLSMWKTGDIYGIIGYSGAEGKSALSFVPLTYFNVYK